MSTRTLLDMGALRNMRILIMLAPPGAQKVPMGPGLKKSHHYHREAIAIIILLTISINIITIAGYAEPPVCIL